MTASEVVAVVDDDPTGMQAVSGVPALFDADDALIAETLGRRPRALFVLTNSRGLPEAEAVSVNRRVGAALARGARAHRLSVRLVSRSDSTLRGHFPAESDALVEGWEGAGGAPLHATVLCPAFPDAGRVTVGGMHFVRDGDDLVPVALTEAARDRVFGYTTSDLGEWVAHRAPGRAVARVTLEHLRGAGGAAVAGVLGAVPGAGVVTVDALHDADLATAVGGIALAESGGRRFLFRTGPSLVRALAGLPRPRVLTDAELAGDGHGLVVVGSHTARTTEQLSRATALIGNRIVELDASRVAGGTLDVGPVVDATVRALARGTTVLATTRSALPFDSEAASLESSRAISSALVEVVRRVHARTALRYVVAKGGITSHDVGRHALGIRRATVRGTLLDGIVSALAPDVPGPLFVVFAGNVGDADALRQVLERLEGRA
jgi:uncharacterized protein YgbK (DUF1537 family)